MKLREFWIVKRDDGETTLFEDSLTHAKDFVEFYSGEIISVREVSSELDDAYAECEKILEAYSLDQGVSQPSWAKEAIATLKKARGE